MNSATEQVVLASPLVAIVGRPNVGKSRLFNRLTGARAAIVEDTPGVTRDRHYGEAEWYGKVFNLVDTGGFEPEAEDELLSAMRQQATIAIEEADVILMLFDGRTGLAPADGEITELLRRSGKRVLYCVNKIDHGKLRNLVFEFHELGLEYLYPISAEHSVGVEDMMTDLVADFPVVDQAGGRSDDGAVHMAVVGRPNVGKSTLINRLLGADRLLTSDIPGTTRDAIDSVLERDGTRFVLIDTAGVRRRRSISMLIEKFSVVRSFKSIDRADVVLIVLDGREGPTDQDARLVGLARDKGKAIILLVNKWDLIDKDERTAGQYAKSLRSRWAFCEFAPIMFISALSGQRVHRILPAALRARESWCRRVPTAELNRFVTDLVARKQPPVYRNRRLRLLYTSQVATRPPTFMMVCNHPKAVPGHYRRFLLNALRRKYGFEGTPIKLFFREKKKKETFVEG